MRFDRIRFRGLGPFTSEVDVDFGALPGLLTAVCGPNGAGKSTLLELLGGTLFRVCPTRGSLRDLATERGAWSEVEVVNGAPWRVRQTVDPVSGKGEALIVDAEGRPVVDTGKVTEADAWMRAHLPPAEVLYASTLGVQQSEGFLAMKPADRKGVLLRILGVERLEALAAGARERARTKRGELEVLAARIADERKRAGDPDAIRAELEDARAEAESAERALETAEAALLVARDAESMARTRARAEGRLATAQARERALRATLADEGSIRRAASDLDGLRRELADVEATERDARAEVGRLSSDVASLRAQWDRAKAAVATAEQRAQRARERLQHRDAVEAAVRDLPAAREALAGAEREREACARELERLRGQRVAGLDQRVASLRAGLGEVARWREDCHAYDVDVDHEPRDFDEDEVERIETRAQEVLAKDDEVVRRAEELPGLTQAAITALQVADARVSEARERASLLASSAARAEDLATAAADLDAATAEAEESRSQATAIRAEAEGLRERRVAAESRAAEIGRRATELAAEARKLGPLAQRVADLDASKARLEDAVRETAEAQAELDALPIPGPAVSESDAKRAVDSARTRSHFAVSRIAQVESDLARAVEGAARLAELEAQRAVVEVELSDLTAIAAGLGRDGVQAALIDAAGPELTELVNDLLRHALGSRWTVTIETTRLSADGRKQLEGLDVRVIDTERGRDAPVETYSGGERVLLGEAVSLALTMLACRRSGLEGVTLVRDESGAALDPERAHAWVSMLRRAAEIVGASRVLLVAHNPEVVELCDSRLVIRDGRVEVAHG